MMEMEVGVEAPVRESKPQRPWWLRVELWLGLAVLALAVPVTVALRHRHEAAPLPKLGHVASFSLVRESGARFGSADLAGRVWVADFVYLGCSESCPMLTSRMGRLQRDLADEERRAGSSLPVQLVSFTIDPTNDTPERLRDYALRWGAEGARWAFTTGSIAEVQHVVADGFKVAYGKVDDGAGAFEIMHGNWFVLVDGAGDIRGYYSTDHPEEMAALERDVLRLAKEGGGRS